MDENQARNKEFLDTVLFNSPYTFTPLPDYAYQHNVEIGFPIAGKFSDITNDDRNHVILVLMAMGYKLRDRLMNQIDNKEKVFYIHPFNSGCTISWADYSKPAHNSSFYWEFDRFFSLTHISQLEVF